MQQVKATTFAEAYKKSLELLNSDQATEIGSRGYLAKEIRDFAMEIENPLSCLYKNEVRGSQLKYISAEYLWYFLGRKDVEYIKRYAKFWETIQNEDGTANSAYGNLIFTKKSRYGFNQYRWALESLVKDKDSRQAILHFNLPEHQYEGNKDFVCTMYGIFHIRKNKLYFSVFMRSNDCMWGTPTDIAFFCMLQQQMLLHLKRTYPDLELGSYTHHANSYHVYERHYDLMNSMLEKEFKPLEIPVLDEKSTFVTEYGEPSVGFRVFESHLDEDYAPETMPSVFRWINDNIHEKRKKESV